MNFIISEQKQSYPETGGLSDTATPKDLEIACDIFALSMCTAYGADEDNPFAFLCTGPQLLFWALKTCEDVREKVLGLRRGSQETHPSFVERIELIPAFISEVAQVEKRGTYLETIAEVNTVASTMRSFILRRLDQIGAFSLLQAES